MRVLANFVAVALFLFFLYSHFTTLSTTTTPEIPSPATHSKNLTPSPLNKIYSIHNTICEPQIPSVYLAFAIVYLTFLHYWISVCFTTKPSFRKIHLLMGSLIILKVLSLIHAAGFISDISKLISSVRLSIVIQLIVSSWKFVKPYMEEVDKIGLMILIPLQVSANVAKIIVVHDEWMDLDRVLVVIDMMSCCVIIFSYVWPMISSISDKNEAKSTRVVRYFYTVVMFNLMFLGVLGMLAKSGRIHGDRNNYLLRSNLVLEMNSLTIYMTMFYMFRDFFLFFVDQDDDEYGGRQPAELMEVANGGSIFLVL